MRVDFHVLNQDKKESFLYMARLTEKVYLLGNQIFIFTCSSEESNEIDAILWNFRDTSFLPHEIGDCAEASASVLISHSPPSRKQDVLVNLSSSIPEFHSKFERIIEIIYASEGIKEMGRKKYREYQKLGCDVHSFIVP